jgi:hypothetical protein
MGLGRTRSAPSFSAISRKERFRVAVMVGLHQRNKFGRRHETADRVIPANQRLHPDDPGISAQAYLRLVMKCELTALDRR